MKKAVFKNLELSFCGTFKRPLECLFLTLCFLFFGQSKVIAAESVTYKNWIVDLDFESKKRQAEQDIWELHQTLALLEIPHLFFTCYESFADSPTALTWNDNYIHPYNNKYKYYNWCKSNGFNTVNPTSYHFGPDAHSAWAKFLFEHILKKELEHDRGSL